MSEVQRFSAASDSVAAARRFVFDSLPGLSPDLADIVGLVVSELATNAIVHARSDFEVHVGVTAGLVRIEVFDEGGGEPVAGAFPPPSQIQGRGLAIVSALADDWGSSERPDVGKGVWAELKISPKVASTAWST